MLIKLDHFPRDENIWNHHPNGHFGVPLFLETPKYNYLPWWGRRKGKQNTLISHWLRDIAVLVVIARTVPNNKISLTPNGRAKHLSWRLLRYWHYISILCMCKKKPWTRQQTYFNAVQDLKAERCAQTQRFPMLQGLKVSLTHESAHLGKATCWHFPTSNALS